MVSADYSSIANSTKYNQRVLEVVRYFIEEGKQLPVFNDIFGGDPDREKRKFLSLGFKGGKVTCVREGFVVDFSVIESLLNRWDGAYGEIGQVFVESSRTRRFELFGSKVGLKSF